MFNYLGRFRNQLTAAARVSIPRFLSLETKIDLPQLVRIERFGTRGFASSNNFVNDISLKGFVFRGIVPSAGILALNDLRPNPGSKRKAHRLGRGTGSGRGKTCGKGHKGQGARGGMPRLGFEGSGTSLSQAIPKRGFSNKVHRLEYRYVNLSKIDQWIKLGRLDPNKSITMKDLRDSGCINKRYDTGVRLLGSGSSEFSAKINIQVSKVSVRAKEAVEKAGGSVDTVYYNELGLRALMKPEWFDGKGRLLPKTVRQIPPKHRGKFDTIGQIQPSTA
mmetsp:Transcript_39926/g.55506  ORF Transcript_39926/g.55506 Transcript_39926/m.55506 type:complete len:277 (+) Transcript_39926:86-916(+)|eukprot:CAMPEP_0196580028 /NCGR_PEP_ID=MMETSP1081-20130531/26428_1 /TAXON_ID=36882 /ORGANISM="Pyramimonas amylifera, Strain CCMP720" /LENGTH=276 /DNA_ID=CAMNT_0041899781 /DNA_START=84 /DNA_END=914 /DNA_ORIENTATION=-